MNWIIGLIIVLLLTPVAAECRMKVGVVGGGVSAATAGTWYYSTTGTDNLYSDNTAGGFGAIGAAVTIGTGTAITKIARYIRSAGSATGEKVAAYASGTLLTGASGTCTPADGTWCVVSVTATGSPSATYQVMSMSNNTGSRGRGDASGASIGVYGTDTYAAFPTTPQTWTSTVWVEVDSVAICAGGTCATGP